MDETAITYKVFFSEGSDEMVHNLIGDGHWKCPQSSVGHCVYNNEHDPAHDICLVCGHPEERK